MSQFHISQASDMRYDASALEAEINAAPRSGFRFHLVGLDEPEPEAIVATDLGCVDAELRRRYPAGNYNLSDVRPAPSEAFTPEEVVALCERIGLTATPYMGGSDRLIIRDADKYRIVHCTEALDGTMHVAEWEVRTALRSLANKRHETAFPE